MLRDRGRRVLHRLGDGGDRASGLELTQQAKSAEIEHPVETLPDIDQKSEWFLMDARGTILAVSARGAITCLSSAAAFGVMGIFGKLAFDQGATAGTLLAARFTIAAVALWCLLAVTGALHQVRKIARRDVAIAFGLGTCGYALQAGCYVVALEHIDASLLSLVLYTFPAIVTVASLALGRERVDQRRVIALGLVSAGLVLILATTGGGTVSGIGVALGLGAAFTYSTYILVGDGVARRVPALPLTTLVCTGAALSLVIGSTITGQSGPATSPQPAGAGSSASRSCPPSRP